MLGFLLRLAQVSLPVQITYMILTALKMGRNFRVLYFLKGSFISAQRASLGKYNLTDMHAESMLQNRTVKHTFSMHEGTLRLPRVTLRSPLG